VTITTLQQKRALWEIFIWIL